MAPFDPGEPRATVAGGAATGLFVPVVGPSGAGKDTLIAAMRERFASDPRIVFVRRTVTRLAGGNEDHASIDPEGFAELLRTGAYALSWSAHGLQYGIPTTALDAVRQGHVAVTNLSRGAVADARSVFPAVRVVSVTAPPTVLAARLAKRGRESGADVTARLARTPPVGPTGPDVFTIDNGGSLDYAVDEFAALLAAFAERTTADGIPLQSKERSTQ